MIVGKRSSEVRRVIQGRNNEVGFSLGDNQIVLPQIKLAWINSYPVLRLCSLKELNNTPVQTRQDKFYCQNFCALFPPINIMNLLLCVCTCMCVCGQCRYYTVLPLASISLAPFPPALKNLNQSSPRCRIIQTIITHTTSSLASLLVLIRRVHQVNYITSINYNLGNLFKDFNIIKSKELVTLNYCGCALSFLINSSQKVEYSFKYFYRSVFYTCA